MESKMYYSERSWHLKTMLLLVLVLLLGAMLVSFINSYTPTAQLKVNHFRWNAKDIHHYSYKLQVISSFSLQEYEPITIEIKDNQMVSIVDKNGHILTKNFSELGKNNSWDFQKDGAIENLFTLLDKGISDAQYIQIIYDQKYGFPKKTVLDWNNAIAGDEFIYYVDDFKVLP